MNSTALPSRYFDTHRQCFAAFRLTWLAYSDGRKREHCSVWKDRIIVASTCRRSVQFGCYITWPWVANCVSVMIKRKREHCSVWKDRIIVASTCRRSVQFGCYITWPWVANCVSVMIKMLPLFNFTISCHGRLAWKTSRCACALGGSHFWLVESTLFEDHVSLRLHREFSLKFNLSN